MKILLTTIVDNTNIGTYLQTLATVRTLENMGHQVSVLNYLRKYILGPKYAMRRWEEKNIVSRILYTITYVYIVNVNIHRVRKFLLDRVSMTNQVKSLEGARKVSSGYDLYLTGSDQVWNCGHNMCFDPIYCNGFTNGRKASYASSIGMEHIPTVYADLFREFLSKYKNISVRESSAATALEEIGIHNVKEVLDPTLLLDKDAWTKEFGNKNEKCERYLLIYSVEEDRSEIVYNIAKKVAEERNLKIFYLTTDKNKKCKYKYDRIINKALPQDFLMAFANAEFTVVSSFHGTAFSINFNIPFYTILPNKYNTRVINLLKKYRLEERMINCTEDISQLNIDFGYVNKELNSDRIDSLNYLRKITE